MKAGEQVHPGDGSPAWFKVLQSWQVVMLATASVALSLASGWTTWDGMSNFTNEPAISLLLTLGVQGLMLVGAWLIGQTFVTSQANFGSRSQSDFSSSSELETWVRTIVLLSFALITFLMIVSFLDSSVEELLSEYPIQQGLVLIGVSSGVTLVAILSGRQLFEKALHAVEVIFRHVVLWVMFLSCLAVSVFFSFDSLFARIFPEDERQRSAEVRARSVTSEVLSDISRASERAIANARAKVMSSREWQDYAMVLDELAGDLGATAEALGKEEAATAEQRQRLSSEHEAATLLQKAAAERLRSERFTVQQRTAALEKQLAELRQDAAAAAERIFELEQEETDLLSRADAELRGVGQTGIAGEGPAYREFMRRAGTVRAEKAVLAGREAALKTQISAKEQLLSEARNGDASLELQIRQLEREAASPISELSGVAAERARTSRGIADTVERLAEARQGFLSAPDMASLTALQEACLSAAHWTSQQPPSDSETGFDQIRCYTGEVQKAAAGLFAVLAGAARFRETCSKKDNAPGNASVDALVAHARSCLRTAALPPQQSASLSRRIDGVERGRDDKSHRFVVTSNAFSDGNRLAILAMVLAVSIDALIFMSGLLGAAASSRPPERFVPPGDASPASTNFDHVQIPEEMQAEALDVLRSVFALGDDRGALNVLHSLVPVADQEPYAFELKFDPGSNGSQLGLQQFANAAIALGQAKCMRDTKGAAKLLVAAPLYKSLVSLASFGHLLAPAAQQKRVAAPEDEAAEPESRHGPVAPVPPEHARRSTASNELREWLRANRYEWERPVRKNGGDTS